MLGWRIAISAILIPAFIAVFVADHQSGRQALWLLLLALALAARCVYELAALLRCRAFQPDPFAAGACTLLVVASGWTAALVNNPDRLVRGIANTTSPTPLDVAGAILSAAEAGQPGQVTALGWVAVAYALSVLALFVKGALRYREPGNSMETLGAELIIVSYAGLLLAVTVQLRWVAGAEAGYLALGSLVVCAKCGDIGAYTLGMLFGKRKLVPLLSPGKTWMGAWGALLFAGVAGVIWFQFAPPLFRSSWQPLPWIWGIVFGAAIGLAGLIGDLCESLIKRDVGQKDAASLLPGFGGLLDVLDSILYAGPVAWILWRVLPLGQ